VPPGVVDSLTARPETSDTIALGLRGPTAQQLRQVVEATVTLMNEEVEKVRAPLVADINAQLAASDTNIARLLEARETLSSLTKAMSVSQSDDATSVILRRVWLSDMVSRNEQRLAEATAARQALAARLSTWRTYPTSIVDEVVVSQNPISPRPTMAMSLAAAIAFAAALVYALIREGSRRV
jgi:uncharacterized protein involved in exopolysaccharide biosynthesis